MNDMIIVNIPPAQIGICDQYVDAAGLTPKKTIVITPLRLTMLTPEINKISFGCNYWKSCRNKECSYCQFGMPVWEEK
jgi:hypothetical protein